jgi:hypothetical protein
MQHATSMAAWIDWNDLEEVGANPRKEMGTRTRVSKSFSWWRAAFSFLVLWSDSIFAASNIPEDVVGSLASTVAPTKINGTNAKSHELGVWQLLWDGNSREVEQPGPRIMHCAFTYDGKMGVYGYVCFLFHAECLGAVSCSSMKQIFPFFPIFPPVKLNPFAIL